MAGDTIGVPIGRMPDTITGGILATAMCGTILFTIPTSMDTIPVGITAITILFTILVPDGVG